MNKKVKRIGCSNIKDVIEQKKLKIVDKETIIELSTFEAKGSSYEASDGNHDDIVMTLVMFGWYCTTPFFINNTDIKMKRMLYEEQVRLAEEELVPFGIHDDYDDSNKYVREGGEIWQVNDSDDYTKFW